MMPVIVANSGDGVDLDKYNVNPEDHTVEVRQLEQDPKTYRDGDTLTLPDVLPDWNLPIEDIWPPVFG